MSVDAYSVLTRPQKLAAFLILIGPESAGEILKQFDSAQLEVVAKEMASMQYVDPSLREPILNEFSGLVTDGLQSALGGAAFTQMSIERAKGDYAAAKLMSRVAPVSPADLDEGISEMDARQIFNLLRFEQMQTVAFIMSFLDVTKAAEVIQMFSPEQREEVIICLGLMEPTSRDWIKKVSVNLQRHFDRRSQQGVQKAGGVSACAGIFKTMSKRQAAGVKEELEMLPPQRPKDIEYAQEKVIVIVSKLEEAEEISIDFGPTNAS